MDTLLRGLSAATNLRFTYVDVTATAREAEQRHLAGPVAGQVLGQALAAVTLISADLGAADERISLQVRADGPVGGLLVEAAAHGGLRGFTNRKTLDALDGAPEPDPAAALGDHGQMQVLHSSSTKVLFTSQVQASPASLATLLARYHNQSLQTPSAVELRVEAAGDRLGRAVGLTAEKMPDGDTEAFVRVLERFNERAVLARLGESRGLADFAELFTLPDLEVRETRALAFRCDCDEDKILGVLRTLPRGELVEIAESGEPQEVTCHFCGDTYKVAPEEIQTLLG